MVRTRMGILFIMAEQEKLFARLNSHLWTPSCQTQHKLVFLAVFPLFPLCHSPSRIMPTVRHFIKRQAWQDFLLRLVISHSLVAGQLYSMFPVARHVERRNRECLMTANQNRIVVRCQKYQCKHKIQQEGWMFKAALWNKKYFPAHSDDK